MAFTSLPESEMVKLSDGTIASDKSRHQPNVVVQRKVKHFYVSMKGSACDCFSVLFDIAPWQRSL